MASLGYSRKIKRPILVVCPATVLRQWVQEFHKWWPAFRVCILHDSGSGLSLMDEYGNDLDDETDYDGITDDESESDSDLRSRRKRTKRRRKEASSSSSKMSSFAKQLVDRIKKDGHVIITTYAAIRMHSKILLPVLWSYVVLDEGHQIRNPDAEITILCKQLRVIDSLLRVQFTIDSYLKQSCYRLFTESFLQERRSKIT